MKILTEIELEDLVSNKVADYSKEISLYVPLSGQPIVMYTCISRGVPSKHYLGLELKLQYSGGLYVYSGDSKPFDITKYNFDDSLWSINEIDTEQGYIDFYNHETCTDDGDSDTHSISKDDAIAIALALGVNAEDLKAAN